MKYSFETLVSVSFYHSYFSNQAFGGFIIEPSKSTSHELLNNGLLLKKYSGGFHILYDSNFAGSARSREDVLKTPLTCQFILRLGDKGFYNYTEPVEGDINRSIYYFHNTFGNGPGLKRSLHSDKYVTVKDLFPLDSFGEKFFVKPFAKLDLTLSEDLETIYSITFKAKETYWRYILVSDDLRSLNSPAIIDSENLEFFEGPEKLPVKGKEMIAFRSKSPISFSQDAKNIFQLVDNYDAGSGRFKVVMRALPSADPNNVTLIESNTRNLNYSEIFIH